MKGTFFQTPLELSLQIEGESWTQGSTIRGALTVKSHTGTVSLDPVGVHLAYGKLKEVRQKSPDAFEILASRRGGDSANWTFELDRNAPITDTLSSLFLLYGSGDAFENLGQLQLGVQPHPVIQDVLSLIETEFRFVVKSKKFSKGYVEVKLAPPSARGFVTLEQMVILFQMTGDNLEAQYSFQLKRLEATAASIDMKKEKKAFSQVYTPAQYRTSSGRFNDPVIQPLIAEVLAQIESKVLF